MSAHPSTAPTRANLTLQQIREAARRVTPPHMGNVFRPAPTTETHYAMARARSNRHSDANHHHRTRICDISFVIPAHNEAERLEATLATYADSFRQEYGDRFEIIIVANGCTDGTVPLAQELAKGHHYLRVIELTQSVGKGGAVLEGFRQATGRRVLFADADGATDAASLIALAKQLDTYDIVIGSRRVEGSSICQRQPIQRRVLSALFHIVVRCTFGLPYRDTQCGAKAFRLSAVRELVERIREHRWAFDVDLLLTGRYLGLSIHEHPVTWTDKPGSKLRISRTARDVIDSLWRMKRRKRAADTLFPVTVPTDSEEDAVVDAAPPRLRILVLNWRCHRHPQAGGSEVNVFEQARHWVMAGHQVTVLCSDPGRESAPERVEIVDGIKVRRKGGRFGVYVHAALHLLAHPRRYDRVLDVANGIPFFSPLFTRTAVTLLVHHVHDQQWFTEFPRPIAIVGRFLELKVVPLLYRKTPVISVSPTTRDMLVEHGFDPARVAIVYNGVTMPKTVPDATVVEPHRIIYIGRLKRYKRVDRLIETAAILRPEFPDLRVDIVGDGDTRDELVALTVRLGLADCVMIHGFIDEQAKVKLLRRAAVFATPSMHEGWGLSVIEANAQGCPAVAYDVPGLNVSIRHDDTGLLADNDDHFRHALAMVLRDTGTRKRLSDGARSWAELFSWETAAHATLEVMAGARSSGTIHSRLAGLPMPQAAGRMG